MAQLDGVKVAILATDGVEQIELTSPRDALTRSGAQVEVIAPHSGKIKGWQHDHWGEEIAVDREVKNVSSNDYDALVIPGGVMNPDNLRMDEQVVALVREFVGAHKPVASICHGPWVLVEADAVRGKKLTSWPSLKTDIVNAGADWYDEEVVRDGNFVTSRKPADLEAFNRETINMFAERTRSAA